MLTSAYRTMKYLEQVKSSSAPGWALTIAKLIFAAEDYDQRHDLEPQDLKALDAFASTIRLRSEPLDILHTAQGLLKILEDDIPPWLITLSMQLSYQQSTAFSFSSQRLHRTLAEINEHVLSLDVSSVHQEVLCPMFTDQIIESLLGQDEEPATWLHTERGRR